MFTNPLFSTRVEGDGESEVFRAKVALRVSDRDVTAFARRSPSLGETASTSSATGLDRMPPRRMLGRCGFDYIIDAGLGTTAADYRKIRLNVFDETEDPAVHFNGVEDPTAQVGEELMKLPAYQELARTLADGGCGAAMLAETSVAVPFVSAVAGALAVTQAIRIASGQAHHAVIAGDAGDLRSIRATQGRKPDRIVVPNAGAAS
jgi:hypothetical protein